MSESRSSSVRRIEFSVDWPPGHVACYLLEGSEPVLVDAGMPDDPGPLDAALASAGYDLSDVAHLVVTHPHVDHVGQASRVIDAADPTVWAPAGVRERFARDPAALGERVRANAAAVGIPGEQREEAVEMAVESLERDSALLPPAAVDRWVAGGDEVTVGGHDVTAVHAPGHQADHLCYLTRVDGERALLSGDMAIEPFRAVALHDGLDDGHREAFAAFSAALDRLAALDVDRVYPGHGGVHAEFDAVVERDQRSLAERLDDVAALLRDGVTTAPGVALSLAGDRDVRYLFPEAMSALAHLERRGRARTETVDGVTHFKPTDDDD